MSFLYKIAEDYIQGKSIYRPIIRILNLLFITSLSSFYYETFFGKYVWIDIFDYKSILDFFIKGNFFIPFSLFLIIYFLLDCVSSLIFFVFKSVGNSLLTKPIKYHYLKRQPVENRINEINLVSSFFSPVNLTKKSFFDFYGKLRTELDHKIMIEISNETKKPKEDLKKTFDLIIKILILIITYYKIFTQLGSWTITIIIICLIISLMFIIFVYKILEILPYLLEKLHYIFESYYKKQAEISASNI